MKKQTVLVPGTVLKESFLDKYQITVAKLSEDIGLSPSAIRQIISNKLKISTVIALRLAKYFDNPVKFWIELQTQYDLSELEKDPKLNEALKKIPKAKKAPPPAKAAAKTPGAAKKAAKADKADKKGTPRKTTAKKPTAKKTGPKAEKKAAAPKAPPAEQN